MSCSSLPKVSAVPGRLPKWEPMAAEDGERGAKGGVCRSFSFRSSSLMVFRFFLGVLGLATGGVRGREVRLFDSFRWDCGFISPVGIVACAGSWVSTGFLRREDNHQFILAASVFWWSRVEDGRGQHRRGILFPGGWKSTGDEGQRTLLYTMGSVGEYLESGS